MNGARTLAIAGLLSSLLTLVGGWAGVSSLVGAAGIVMTIANLLVILRSRRPS